jgi:hypothetical protein
MFDRQALGFDRAFRDRFGLDRIERGYYSSWAVGSIAPPRPAPTWRAFASGMKP